MGIGEVLGWAEFWLLIPHGCGYETMFGQMAHRFFEPEQVIAVVIDEVLTTDAGQDSTRLQVHAVWSPAAR